MKGRLILGAAAIAALSFAQIQIPTGAVFESGVNSGTRTSSGTDDFVVTMARPILAYKHQVCYTWTSDVTSEGAASVAIDGLAAKDIRKDGITALADGDIKEDQIVTACYDSVNDVMQLVIGSGSGGGDAPYIQTFTGQTSLSIAGSTHGKGTNIDVFLQEDGSTVWKRIVAGYTVGKSSGDVDITFSSSRSGRIMITQLRGSSGGVGGITDHAQLTNLDYPSSGHTGFAAALHSSHHQDGGDDEVATTTAAAGAIPKADGAGKIPTGFLPDLSGTYQVVSGKNQSSGYAGLDGSSLLTRSQLPVMTAASSVSAGAAGAVPQPAAGDQAKCLKGNATWGDCGSGITYPGGSSGNWQVNVLGAFSGVAGTSYDSVNNILAYTGEINTASGYMTPRSILTTESACSGKNGAIAYVSNATSGRRLKACESGVWVTQGDGNDAGGGGGAPTNATYIVESSDSTLSNERRLVAGAGLQRGADTSTFTMELDCSITAACQDDNNNFTQNNQFGMGNKYLDFSIPNASPTGTSLWKLAVGTVNGTELNATIAPANSNKLLGVVVAGPGTSGYARIARVGRAFCVFDSAPAVGNWVAVSTTTSGNCRDAGSGSNPPSSGFVGQVYSSIVSGGAYEVILMF